MAGQQLPLFADGPLVILGVDWTEPTAEGAMLRVRRGEQSAPSESTLVPTTGLTLNYRSSATDPRHCVGHRSPRRNDGRYLDCLNRPQPGDKTCVSCSVANAELAADLHHAHTRDPAMIHHAVRRHLDQANVLYVAVFRDGSLKIGTSTAGRRLLRWSEQGAWLVSEVATVDDGFTVRRLEDLITEQLSFAQSVNSARKIKGMATPRSDQDLSTILDTAVQAVHELLAGSSAQLSDERWQFPRSDRPLWNRLHRYPVKLTEGQHHFEIEAACGRLAVISKPGGNDRFIVDLGQLAGYEIELGNFTPESLMVQDSLF